MSSINAENIIVTNLNVEYINGQPVSYFGFGNSSDPCSQPDNCYDCDGEDDGGCPQCFDLPSSYTGTIATNVNITTKSDNVNYGVVFAINSSGSLEVNNADALTYNPSTSTLTTQNLGNIAGIYQKTKYLTNQSNTITIGSIITDGMIYMSTYSSAYPSIINDVIAIDLPTPTASLEGFTLTFRKMRGSVDTTSPNWTFSAPGSYILSTTRSLTTTGGANASSTQNDLNVKFIIAGYSNVYYYLQI